jgi:membrane protein DedA with SNARE-associated domain
VPPFAGVVGIGAVRALAPVVVASGIWYGFLVWLAHRLGQNWYVVSHALKHLSWWLAAVALVVTSLLTWAALRWRRRTLAREA